MNSIPSKFLPVFLFFLLSPVILSAQYIQYLTADRFTHYAYDDWISYAPALQITSIDMDDSYIYFATAQGGILRYDKYQNVWDYPFTTSNGLRSNHVKYVIYSAADLILYAATPAGIDFYNNAERNWSPAQPGIQPSRFKPPTSDLQGIDQVRDYHFPPYYRPVNSALPDFFTGINLLYQPGGIVYDRYNRQFNFTDRLVDSFQRIWIGSDGLGPLKADLYNWHLESLPQSLPAIHPRDLLLLDGQIWIGGLNDGNGIGGITLWNTAGQSWQYFEAQFINQLYKDDVVAISANQTSIVFATTDGVAVFMPQKNKWTTLNSQAGLEGDRVNDVLVIGDTAYVASEFGFNWINLNSLKVHQSDQNVLDHVWINQLTYKDSLVWAATKFGLYSIDIKRDLILNHPAHAAMVDYDLTAVETIAEEIWMANRNGIACWDQRQDEWTSYSNLNLQLMVRDIASTAGCVWFATDQGLLKFDRKRNYWRLYTEKDGLISRDTYHLDPQNDYLWITTPAGITRFRWWRKNRID